MSTHVRVSLERWRRCLGVFGVMMIGDADRHDISGAHDLLCNLILKKNLYKTKRQEAAEADCYDT
jgi:hypothetical protein